MKNLDLQNKKVAVLGMGIEGLALVDFLFDKDCDISVLDKLHPKEIEERLTSEERKTFNRILQDEKIVKTFGEDYLENLDKFDVVFRSPGISYHNPKIAEARKKGVEISSQIKLFFELCPCKIIGVTGTKGKGTTASLIFEILKSSSQFSILNSQSVLNDKMKTDELTGNWKLETGKLPQVYLAGNIGYPAITLIPELKSDDIVILELSSFQLMDLERRPQIAVVTNLLIDHLDYHRDEEEYRKAKENIVKYQTENDFAILNKRSTFDEAIISDLKSSIRYFGSMEGVDAIVTNEDVILDPQNRNAKICDKSNIELFGHHNLENIAAAVLVADILNINMETVKQVVKEFKGLPHRIEFVAEINGVKFINDSFATNPEPTMAAINSFSENKILILGGSSKGADFTTLVKKISCSNVKAVVLIGAEADKIERSLVEAAYSGQIKKGISNIDEIVKTAKDLASPGDVIILSPACASFGLFKNYKDRGEKFKNAVLNLKSN